MPFVVNRERSRLPIDPNPELPVPLDPFAIGTCELHYSGSHHIGVAEICWATYTPNDLHIAHGNGLDAAGTQIVVMTLQEYTSNGWEDRHFERGLGEFEHPTIKYTLEHSGNNYRVLCTTTHIGSPDSPVEVSDTWKATPAIPPQEPSLAASDGGDWTPLTRVHFNADGETVQCYNGDTPTVVLSIYPPDSIPDEASATRCTLLGHNGTDEVWVYASEDNWPPAMGWKQCNVWKQFVADGPSWIFQQSMIPWPYHNDVNDTYGSTEGWIAIGLGLDGQRPNQKILELYCTTDYVPPDDWVPP